MQILWKPKVGDRVLIHRDGKRIRTRIAEEFHNYYLTDAWPGHFLKSIEMFFVPRQQDYVVMLQSFRELRHIELTECADGNLDLSRRFPHPTIKGRYNYIHANGRPVSVLASLLDARVIDNGLNQIINTMVDNRLVH